MQSKTVYLIFANILHVDEDEREQEVAVDMIDHGLSVVADHTDVEEALSEANHLARVLRQRPHPTQMMKSSGDIVYVSDVTVYRGEEKNGDIDYDNLVSLKSYTCQRDEEKRPTYLRAYNMLLAWLGEYLRANGFEEENVQLDGIDSHESSEYGDDLRSLTAMIRFTYFNKERNKVQTYTARAFMSATLGFFPQIGRLERIEERDAQ